MNADPWWRNAVFYRVSPATFQDSNADGKGDLRGIAQRMVYLQSLSVDAVVLDSPFDEDGFDELLREATAHHIRLLVSLPSSSDNALQATARSWLTRGCAGIWLHVPARADAAQTSAAVQALRKLTDSFPGQRVLVQDTTEDPAVLAQPGAQLVTRSIIDRTGDGADAFSLRVQLNQISQVPLGSEPIVVLQRRRVDDAEKETHWRALENVFANMIFVAGGATALNAGQEIGFDTTAVPEHAMQWTPSNVTRAVEAEPVQEAQQPRRPENEYGTYVPYVAPAKKLIANSAPDLNALPGFSSVAVATFAPGTHDSVAAEDADPNSLLNYFRRLSQLHHENATLRTGPGVTLNRDSDDVLLWMRRPRVGSSFAGAVFVAANLSDGTKTVSLAPESNARGPGADLVPLLSSTPRNTQILQRRTSVTVAPWSVVVLGSER